MRAVKGRGLIFANEIISDELFLHMDHRPPISRRLKKTVVLLLCLSLGACYSPPFRRTELAPLGDVEPEKVVARFGERLPAVFETENTLIFRFFRNEIAALGYASVNRETESFEIVCVNHMGVMLFHISGDDSGNHLRYAMPEFKEHPEFVDAVGNDIRRVYFDLLPREPADAQVRNNRIIYRQAHNDTSDVFVFGGEENLLIEKSERTRWRTMWKVNFYEYFQVSGDEQPAYIFPRGIVLHNRRYRYRLIIRTRSVDLKK